MLFCRDKPLGKRRTEAITISSWWGEVSPALELRVGVWLAGRAAPCLVHRLLQEEEEWCKRHRTATRRAISKASASLEHTPSRLSQRRFAFPPFSSCEQPDVLQQLLKRLVRQSCNCANGNEEESPKSKPHFCNLGGCTISRTTNNPYLLLYVANPLAILMGVPLQPASCRRVWKPHALLPLLQCCRRKASIKAGQQ